MATPHPLPAPLYGGTVTHVLPIAWESGDNVRVHVQLGALDAEGAFVASDVGQRSYELTPAEYDTMLAETLDLPAAPTYLAARNATRARVLAALDARGW